MRVSDESDDRLKLSMAIDSDFKERLYYELVKKEYEMEKRMRSPKIKKWPIAVSAFAVAAGLMILGGFIHIQKGSVSADEVLVNARNIPQTANEYIIAGGDQGTYVKTSSSLAAGPKFINCSTMDNLLPTGDISETTELIYVNQRQAAYLKKTTSVKADNITMRYYENNIAASMSALISNDTLLVSKLLRSSNLVDKNGNSIAADSTAEKLKKDGEDTYVIYLKDVDDTLCTNHSGKLDLRLIVRQSDYKLVGWALFDGEGFLDSEKLVESKLSVESVQRVKFTDVEAEFLANGYNKYEAARQSSSAIVSSKVVENIYFNPSALGEIINVDPATSSADYIQFSFKDRDDLRIVLVKSDFVPQGDGIPSGVRGFGKDGSNYYDVFMREIGMEATISNIQSEQIVNGLEVISFAQEGGLAGVPEQFYTVINTGNSNFPAIVVVESADNHARYTSAWLNFLDSVSVK